MRPNGSISSGRYFNIAKEVINSDKEGPSITRVFFATDIHGSEKCFRKFINAGKFYHADVLIMGGDISGKLIIPIFEEKGRHTCQFVGRTWKARNRRQLEELEQRIRFTGYYPFRITREFFKEIQDDQARIDELFQTCMQDSIKAWVGLAEERLRGSGIKCFIAPGNDDPFSIDQALEGSQSVVNPEGQVTWIDDRYCMVSTGYSNITPWHSPREMEEEELETYLERVIKDCSPIDFEHCIFNLHCPPYKTKLDQAPKLDQNLKPVIEGGQLVMKHAGSMAVRSLIERYQPLLTLHGHIHESKGDQLIGRTLAVNPGSEYSEGILRGVIVDLDEQGVKNYQFTAG